MAGFEQKRCEDQGEAIQRVPAVERDRAARYGEQNPAIDRVADIMIWAAADQRMIFFDLDRSTPISRERDTGRDRYPEAREVRIRPKEVRIRPKPLAIGASIGLRGTKGCARIAGMACGTASAIAPRKASA